MKRPLILSFLMAEAMCGYAQLSINPEAGINFSTTNTRAGGVKADSKHRIGYKVGAVIDIAIYKGFYIQPGIFYTVKGATLNTSTSPISSENKMTLNYLEVPINLAYRYDFGNAGAVFVFVGPYWGIGMNGVSKNNTSGVYIESDIKYGDDVNNQFEKADFGLNFGVGYISPAGIYLRLQYGVGLSNIANANNANWNNQVMTTSLGYTFDLSER